MMFRYMARPRALILDDDIDFIYLMQRVLRTLGIELAVAKDKTDFVQRLKSEKPRFCLLDLSVESAHDGFGVIEEIRASSEGIIVFVVSADAGIASVVQALELGADDYFLKPVDRQSLKQKISHYLKDDIVWGAEKPFRSVSIGPQAVHVEFVTEIVAVDEFGVDFRSPHLIPKGNLVRLSGEFVSEISGQERVPVAIVSVGLDPGQNTYVYYAEFEGLSKETLGRVRSWLNGRAALGAAS